MVEVSYVGYQPDQFQIDFNEDQRFNINLIPEPRLLDEVVISSIGADENVRSAEMSVTKLNIREVKEIPVILGEQDILKTIQLLPGVSATGEGGSGF